MQEACDKKADLRAVPYNAVMLLTTEVDRQIAVDRLVLDFLQSRFT